MKKKNLWQVIKFTLFSASAGIIQIGTYTLFFEVLFILQSGYPFFSTLFFKSRFK